jgi:hypothetical protein
MFNRGSVVTRHTLEITIWRRKAVRRDLDELERSYRSAIDGKAGIKLVVVKVIEPAARLTVSSLVRRGRTFLPDDHHPHRIADVGELFSGVCRHWLFGNRLVKIDHSSKRPVPSDDVTLVAGEPDARLSSLVRSE